MKDCIGYAKMTTTISGFDVESSVSWFISGNRSSVDSDELGNLYEGDDRRKARELYEGEIKRHIQLAAKYEGEIKIDYQRGKPIN